MSLADWTGRTVAESRRFFALSRCTGILKAAKPGILNAKYDLRMTKTSRHHNRDATV
jgi:hypothetical protein